MTVGHDKHTRVCVCMFRLDVCVTIEAAGGIGRVVAAMADHAGTSAVQLQGCGTLLNLALSNVGTWCVVWAVRCALPPKNARWGIGSGL